MKFSIIIPSYNQPQFISETFDNLKELKFKAVQNGVSVELLLFDSYSNEDVQKKIEEYKSIFDFVEIEKDNGQYDAINKGIQRATGDYWTWLNTDDKIDINGFLQIVSILKKDESIDYIYGSIEHIDAKGKSIRKVKAKPLTSDSLLNSDPGIYQPGSFFKKKFTNKICLLANYNCCFDYEYVLRILKNQGKLVLCETIVSQFRIHNQSKTGSIITAFVEEQIEISRKYGRKVLSKHSFISMLRLIKHRYLMK